VTKLRIDLAYCVELSRVVDIQEACIEFFSQSTRKKFNFLCSDPVCRKLDVRVTAVNHYRIPEEDDTVFMSPHYRLLDDHHVTCEWMQLDAALHQDEAQQALRDESEQESARRKLCRKITRLITKFVIPETDGGADSEGIATEFERIRTIQNPYSKRKALKEYVHGVGSTATSLEALVTCFEELRTLKEQDQILQIAGVGKMSFRETFRQVALGPTTNFAVFHGGARLTKRYGYGATLTFIDKLNKRPISIYVPSATIKSRRHGSRMARLFDELERSKDKRPYIRIYWIGNLVLDEEHGWNATVNSLAHIVLRIAFPRARPQNTQVATEADE
jgi:hypothetical protein